MATAPASGCSPQSSSVKSLPPPCPKSPPDYPDLYGKRRELAKVQMLEREINFLEIERFCGGEPGPSDTNVRPTANTQFPSLLTRITIFPTNLNFFLHKAETERIEGHVDSGNGYVGSPVSTSHGFVAAAAPDSLAVVRICLAAASAIPALVHPIAAPAVTAAAAAVITATDASRRRPTSGAAAAAFPPPLPVAVVYPASDAVKRTAAAVTRRAIPAAAAQI
ncbi:unnamed protein product [Linum tenue]|uniref:Uncharacterized protein n=1 Tax=Linum tenue TaxID=586396 RepID=A0AAV0HQN0_9ROSI|nr:unnamed protein product [Linum tenue]